MAKAQQIPMEGFEQVKIPAIERWAAKYDEKRSIIDGLETELANAEFKLAEEMHANADKLDHQQGKNGVQMLVYERNDFRVIIKGGKEKVNVKIGEKSKGAEPGETEE